ncbi:YjbH domain-containing protein [Sulfitobacter sp. 1A05707]|uniref:YjbH domain-containing protein n=1 Tax=Sulfitobacter sp. 1A05707 TaxID=3368560 RepID=UPI0037452047
MHWHAKLGVASFVLCLAHSDVVAEQPHSVSVSTYGTPGLVELPTARVFRSGRLTFSANHFGPNWRYAGTFQMLPRVYGSFRYLVLG